MALPDIRTPSGLPSFLAAGHAVAEVAMFAQMKPAAGHRRTRRLYTGPERTVKVSARYSAAQMAAFDAWFEDVLLAGERFFSVQVQDQGSAALLWWKARWEAPCAAEPLPGGYWRITGTLHLFEAGSATAPAATREESPVR